MRLTNFLLASARKRLERRGLDPNLANQAVAVGLAERSPRAARRFLADNTAQLDVGVIVGVVVAVILFVAVAIPVTNDVINSANVTGTTSTVLNVLPIMLAVAPLVAITALFLLRR